MYNYSDLFNTSVSIFNLQYYNDNFRFIKEKLMPVIQTELQFLFLCHLVGPFLHRFNSDLPRAVIEITIIFYELLEQIDKAQAHLTYIDPICDLLYPLTNIMNQ